MKALLVPFVLLLFACSPSEPENITVTGNVTDDAVPVFLAALNLATDSAVDVDALVTLTESVSIDEEKQQKFAVTVNGTDTELLYHVWREQQGWVHLYLSTPSSALAQLVDSELQPHKIQE
ncbi:MAG: hypothetical protein AAFN78_00150 [Pseudomonadota bacterium]